jgi:hypothetical protein
VEKKDMLPKPTIYFWKKSLLRIPLLGDEGATSSSYPKSTVPAMDSTMKRLPMIWGCFVLPFLCLYHSCGGDGSWMEKKKNPLSNKYSNRNEFDPDYHYFSPWKFTRIGHQRGFLDLVES